MFGQREAVWKAKVGQHWLQGEWKETQWPPCGSAADRTLHPQAESSAVFPNRAGCLPEEEEPPLVSTVEDRKWAGVCLHVCMLPA